jgi:hypothetical protein
MTKPQLTLKSVNGLPITEAEFETNLTNLRDATIGLQAGTGGTQVVSDLNGVITLVAGAGVTLTGDNGAKTITIDAGAANLTSNDLRFGANDTGQVIFRAPTGFTSKDLVLQWDEIQIDSPTGVDLINSQSGQMNINGGLFAGNYNSQIMLDTITLTLTNGTQVQVNTSRFEVIDGYIRVGNFTTTERNNITNAVGGSPLPGIIIFNETTSKFQGYDGTAWVDLN